MDEVYTTDEKIKFLFDELIKIKVELFEIKRQLGIVPKEHD